MVLIWLTESEGGSSTVVLCVLAARNERRKTGSGVGKREEEREGVWLEKEVKEGECLMLLSLLLFSVGWQEVVVVLFCSFCLLTGNKGGCDAAKCYV